jgi:hypothetical protein
VHNISIILLIALTLRTIYIVLRFIYDIELMCKTLFYNEIQSLPLFVGVVLNYETKSKRNERNETKRNITQRNILKCETKRNILKCETQRNILKCKTKRKYTKILTSFIEGAPYIKENSTWHNGR